MGGDLEQECLPGIFRQHVRFEILRQPGPASETEFYRFSFLEPAMVEERRLMVAGLDDPGHRDGEPGAKDQLKDQTSDLELIIIITDDGAQEKVQEGEPEPRFQKADEANIIGSLEKESPAFSQENQHDDEGQDR